MSRSGRKSLAPASCESQDYITSFSLRMLESPARAWSRSIWIPTEHSLPIVSPRTAGRVTCGVLLISWSIGPQCSLLRWQCKLDCRYCISTVVPLIRFTAQGPGVEKLRRVLIAYSWRDPSIGYCQGKSARQPTCDTLTEAEVPSPGMNLLAALLLLVYPGECCSAFVQIVGCAVLTGFFFADEEDAFWMLASVLERLLPSDYYSSQLLVSQADQRVLQDLMQLALPDVSNRQPRRDILCS